MPRDHGMPRDLPACPAREIPPSSAPLLSCDDRRSMWWWPGGCTRCICWEVGYGFLPFSHSGFIRQSLPMTTTVRG
uniref:Uncharacterized protein n=1 Tax=Zea mays TaxID=4577 RepID=A0A804RJT8_MAIZE